MAQRRMFSLKVIDTDEFLDMPQSSQYLYYNLAMRADDDGFISNPKRVMRMIGCNDDDLKILVAKQYVIPFERGICVIRHWRIHNLIRTDRYTETEYLQEKGELSLKNGKYEKKEQNVIPNGNQMEPQVRIGKVRKGKDSIGYRESTPAQKMKLFVEKFEKDNLNTEWIEILGEKWKNGFSALNNNQQESFIAEVAKFVSYWTELNKSGTKTRWEQQPTFEVGRRLSTWFSRSKEFNNFNKPAGVIKV